ncbi:MAG: hypothetical protein ACOY3X_00950 [Pseudomonadota bacterium]
MSDIIHGLFIKYGLRTRPTDAQAAKWAELTNKYIAAGAEKESAGARAAKEIFSDYNTMVYASEADTIEALLRQAQRK